jgi:hypothetical protein
MPGGLSKRVIIGQKIEVDPPKAEAIREIVSEFEKSTHRSHQSLVLPEKSYCPKSLVLSKFAAPGTNLPESPFCGSSS